MDPTSYQTKVDIVIFIFSMSWHTVQFTMYKMAKGSTLWSSGEVFFSLSKDILSFDLQEKIKSNWEVTKQSGLKISTILFDFPKMFCPDPKPISTNVILISIL